MSVRSSVDCPVEQEVDTIGAIFGEHTVQLAELGDSYRVRAFVSEPLYGHSGAVISLQLGVTLPQQYAQCLDQSGVVVTLEQVRGLSTEDTSRLSDELHQRLSQMDGLPVLFELIQHCKDFIQAQDSLSISCPLCLTSFSDSHLGAAAIMSTECGHFFHSHCLSAAGDWQLVQRRERLEQMEPLERRALEVDEAERNVSPYTCPVCRCSIPAASMPQSSVDVCNAAASSSGQTAATAPDAAAALSAWRRRQRDLEPIFEKQRVAGGHVLETNAITVDEHTRFELPEPQSMTDVSGAPSARHESKKRRGHNRFRNRARGHNYINRESTDWQRSKRE